jgi:hypothetical protein
MSRALLLAACSCWMLVACSEDDERRWPLPPPEEPGPTGTLEYRWSIDGRQEAQDCEDVGALLFESVVIDQGFIVDGVSVPCEDFVASLPLYRDDFRSRSSLTDSRGYPALGRIIEDLFLINVGEVTTLVLDFPRSGPSSEPDAGVTGSTDAGTVAPNTPTPDAGEGMADAGADGG